MRHILLTLFLIVSSILVFAQDVKLISGSLTALKGVKTFNLQFDYDSMSVGELATEQEFITRRKSYLTKTYGYEWEIIWKEDRKKLFEPKFIKVFAEYSDLDAGDHPDGRYTLLFKTTHTEPGYNVGVWHKRAEIDGEAWIVETTNPNNVIAKISVQNCEGLLNNGNDYNSGSRLVGAYALAGKRLGKFLSKELK